MGPACNPGPKLRCENNRLIQSGSPCVNDPENLRPSSCAASCVAAWEEVVAVALVEPDFVDASQIREEPARQGRSSVNIDHGRISNPLGPRPPHTHHYL